MWYCVKEGKEAQDLRGKSGWIAITQRGKAICYNGHQWAAAFQGHSITYHRHQHDTIGNSKTENLHYCTNLVPHNLIVFPSFFYSSSSFFLISYCLELSWQEAKTGTRLVHRPFKSVLVQVDRIQSVAAVLTTKAHKVIEVKPCTLQKCELIGTGSNTSE